MSMTALKFVCLAFYAVVAFWPKAAPAQPLSATITVDKDRGIASVKGGYGSYSHRTINPPANLRFESSAIGVPSLASRISKVELFNSDGTKLPYRRIQPGEFLLDPAINIINGGGIASFSYEVDLRPPAEWRSASHASWLTTESGLLFFKDILPMQSTLEPKVSLIKLELPKEWTAATTLNNTPHGSMMSSDASVETALIGPRIRQRTEEKTTIATNDKWQVSDDAALRTSTSILTAYRDIFGTYPSDHRLILLAKFPQQNIPKGTWEAETRGNTVILVSSDMQFESQAIQRLSEQLRHELFHLWIPNGVNWTGRYDWFYEGFALYQSLKTGVSLNQISFADFLDTLSRAHTIDLASSAGRLSLIEASSARFAGNETQVYARGMVVAFLCDLILLRDSNGKRSVETVLRQLLAGHRPDARPEDGNAVVLRTFDVHPGLRPVIEDYVRGNARVEWSSIIAAAGLENEPGLPATRLRVATTLTGKQKTVLDKLGYNSWRKLTRK